MQPVLLTVLPGCCAHFVHDCLGSSSPFHSSRVRWIHGGDEFVNVFFILVFATYMIFSVIFFMEFLLCVTW